MDTFESAPKKSYDHKLIEKAAQKKWEESEIYKTDLEDSRERAADPYYLLVEFPYPSGDLHTGHWYAYAMPDIYARYLRMTGKNVLFPFGFDSFGLPAENAAIKRGLDPKKWTYDNMDSMREQVKSMGTSFDWSKQVVTSDPEYYRWTQWLFSKLYEHKLAERREAPVKWCPQDQTVLANEQVINGHCERCGHLVEEKILTQWFMKITQYAKRLLADLDPLPWPNEIKEAQRAWIGESEGAKLSFALQNVTLEDLEMSVDVFTTRPDTIYGVTYIVLAPEHPMVDLLAPAILNAAEVEAYKTATGSKTERERSENKEKTGVRLDGIHAVNPATNEPIPVFVADYVLATYGTGAVMAVPAHDEHDFEFAKKFDLPIVQVVVPCSVDANNPPQDGFENVMRDTVVVHLRDKSTGKFALLNWHGTFEGITTAIMGGIEEGQTPEEAALAEIREEAGLENVKIVHRAPWITAAKYCASHKNQNRTAHAYGFIAEVENLSEQKEVAEYEQKTHTLVWIDEKKVLASVTPAHQKLIWEILHKEEALTGNGYLINSGEFDGRDAREAMAEIVEAVGGELVTNYRLRDWLISRQRYWGCPIPVVYDPEGEPHLVPAEHLPWVLPTDVNFTLTGKSPLATSAELKERVEKIFGEGWTPEYDTLDTFVDSSWYFLRYLDSQDENEFSDQKMLKKWTPVNRYSGGSEHTTMHLLYARFFHKALFDLALVPTNEPFLERFNRGLIMGPDGQKMSKSKGNVINPDELVEKYGADAVRMYLAFIGPYNEPGQYPWNLDGVEAMRRFLDRIYKLSAKVQSEAGEKPSEEIERAVGKAAGKIAGDITRFKFNTAISHLMVLVRDLESLESVPVSTYLELIILLAPFAPHLTEHLWEKFAVSAKENVRSTNADEGESEKDSQNTEMPVSVHQAAWPYQNMAFEEELATVIVQINSKKKGEIRIAKEASQEEALAAAQKIDGILGKLHEELISRIVYVPGRILNLVIPSSK
jgi:leucyl-tRNA synthetase